MSNRRNGTYRLFKSRTFEAAHKLPEHDGKCARLHGHSWSVTVVIETDRIVRSGPKTGMAVDFGDVSTPLDKLIEDRLDHYYLNESVPIQTPTSEALARWIFDELETHYQIAMAAGEIPAMRLVAVEIGETCTSKAIYAVEHDSNRENRGD